VRWTRRGAGYWSSEVDQEGASSWTSRVLVPGPGGVLVPGPVGMLVPGPEGCWFLGQEGAGLTGAGGLRGAAGSCEARPAQALLRAARRSGAAPGRSPGRSPSSRDMTPVVSGALEQARRTVTCGL